MPKIIENLEAKLIDEAKKQVREVGYGAVTIRSVAKACGVGVGTVYNYFPSKDDLLASYILSDWKRCIDAIEKISSDSSAPEPVVQCIYDQLVSFARRHQSIFTDPSAVSSFSGSFSRYHALLRAQLSAPVRKFCSSDFSAEFIGESLLTWTMAGKSFDEIYYLIRKLF